MNKIILPIFLIIFSSFFLSACTVGGNPASTPSNGTPTKSIEAQSEDELIESLQNEDLDNLDTELQNLEKELNSEN